jgi:hypothetical protein
VVLVLVAASSLLRVSVAVANKLVAPGRVVERVGSVGQIPEWDWDDWDDEFGAVPRSRRHREPAIPYPGIGLGALITFFTAAVFGFGFIVTGFAAEEIGFRMWREETKLGVGILNLPLAAVGQMVSLIVLLPTTFWRAAMVTFVYGLIILGFVVFIALVVAMAS